MKPVTRTYSAKSADFPIDERKWYLMDAEKMILGRMSVQIANLLRGKDKPTYTPHVDTGSFVVVINASKVQLTGKKLDQKIYYKHTGYIGNMKSATLREMLDKKPEEVIKKAVIRMLPKNKLSQASIKKLKIYPGPDHPHAAQKPVALEL